METTAASKSFNGPRADAEDDIFDEKPDPKTFRPDLYQASMKNETEKVLAFLLDYVPCDYVDPKSQLTALHWAALHGNVTVVKKLLSCGASLPYQQALGKHRATKSHAPPFKDSFGEYAPDDEPVDEEKSFSNQSDVDSYDEFEANEQTQQSADQTVDSSIDYTINTPLLWAAYKGHFEVVWLLLLDGYSSNDLDSNGNNALHLAAASGHVNVVRTLINDGANSNLVNIFKNLPIDMATKKETRELLSSAMEKYASNTDEDSRAMNRQNVKMYKGLLADLQCSIKEAAGFETKNLNEISSTMRALEDRVRISKDWELDALLVAQAERLIQKMDATLELSAGISSLRSVLPLTTQSDYATFALKLEKLIKRAEELGINESKMSVARALISQAQAEYWLSNCIKRLEYVTAAEEEHEHDMNTLSKAIDKYSNQLDKSSSDLITKGRQLYRRLYCELGMSRAINSVPIVRLPMENPPAGYWQPSDVGKIKETPEYPNPPIEPPGEYIWEPSASYTSLKEAIERLKEFYEGATLYNANPSVAALAKERLVKAEKDFKLLETKNIADKALGIEAVIKLVKKLKKKKKKKVPSAAPKAVAQNGFASESDNDNEEE